MKNKPYVLHTLGWGFLLAELGFTRFRGAPFPDPQALATHGPRFRV